MSAPVAYNWRVRRRDRRPMTVMELGAVMAYFEDHQDAPPGYEIHVVNWRAPTKSGAWGPRRYPHSTSDAVDAMTSHFYYVLRGRLGDVRVGSVKR